LFVFRLVDNRLPMDQAATYKTELKGCLERFGANLRRLRTAPDRRLSQEELAFATNLHRTEIGSLEQGRAEPRLSTLLILADGLAVTLDELVTGVPVPRERRPGPRRRPRADPRRKEPSG
jgi:transcriptional regulator with XRE-family HTH domain